MTLFGLGGLEGPEAAGARADSQPDTRSSSPSSPSFSAVFLHLGLLYKSTTFQRLEKSGHISQKGWKATNDGRLPPNAKKRRWQIEMICRHGAPLIIRSSTRSISVQRTSFIPEVKSHCTKAEYYTGGARKRTLRGVLFFLSFLPLFWRRANRYPGDCRR